MTMIPEILLELMRKDNVQIRDFPTVQKKILTLIKGGGEALQVITDFDQTITKYHHHGELCDSTFSVLTNSTLFSSEFKDECDHSCKKYGPIEINHDMSIEDRIPYMIQWQKEFLQSLIRAGVNRDTIQEAINGSKTYLRDKADTVLSTLDKSKVPVLIFSAGIEDVLVGLLQKNSITPSNFRIFSNQMVFDQDHFVIGFRPPTIHSFNKSRMLVDQQNGNYLSKVAHRSNVILLGDNVGDIHMADGLNSDATILRIGFLENSALLDMFLMGYDIVIVNDQSWTLVQALVESVLNTS